MSDSVKKRRIINYRDVRKSLQEQGWYAKNASGYWKKIEAKEAKEKKQKKKDPEIWDPDADFQKVLEKVKKEAKEDRRRILSGEKLEEIEIEKTEEEHKHIYRERLNTNTSGNSYKYRAQRASYGKMYREKNKEKIKEAQRRWREKRKLMKKLGK